MHPHPIFTAISKALTVSRQMFGDGNSNCHNHRLSQWLAQPYKGMLLAGLKAHRNICHLQSCATATDVAAIFSLPCANGRKFASKLARLAVTEGL